MATKAKARPKRYSLEWLRSLTKRDFDNGATLDEIDDVYKQRDELLGACMFALSHVQELREAWRTGALSERDGLGGTRSNRNVDVEVTLRHAIEKCNL